MRIAYVINSIEGGGAALPVPMIVHFLQSEGAEVIVLALTRRDGRAGPAIEAAGARLIVREGGEKDHGAAGRWLDAQVRALQPTHIWTSLTRATLFGQIVGRMRGVPVVSWQHAAYLKPWNRRLLRLLQPLSRLWIGDSESVTALTRDRLGVPDDRLICWPIFRADPSAPVAAPWQPGEPVRVGSLGRLHPVKGYAELIEALALMPPADVPFEVTVAGEGGERAALEALGGGKGVRIALPGYVDHPRAWLATQHLYVQPSRSEGLCVGAHEAMQAGLPVLASAVGELPWSIVDGVTGQTVPPRDPAALATALHSLLSRPERLADMGRAGRERLLERFSAERFEQVGRQIVVRMRAMNFNPRSP
ncbi:glycosyltransferase involved in cell wall biosynthesis [Sphingomonas vulcanisoli]|uniref:Glycosyltransferase involved in cell wall biosynthesis n=1 Tax=Sphingomonas vulcanisoli TaxID=1658060 RepID=A0ABX0TQ63_9SPHN|nr:glycosyltransferase family 4 protein [Sphingomonas vulcanisoli]NIJ07566.1 glycosyltransferase involved in cell wall biosynthesis [Sphingomonas vulcanisoli]